jgi:hypothetical protein
LTHHEIDDAIALATTPATRLAIILAAVHAARTKDIGELCLDGIDPNNRRLTLAGRTSLPTGRPSPSAGVATSLTSRPGMAGRTY